VDIRYGINWMDLGMVEILGMIEEVEVVVVAATGAVALLVVFVFIVEVVAWLIVEIFVIVLVVLSEAAMQKVVPFIWHSIHSLTSVCATSAKTLGYPTC